MSSSLVQSCDTLDLGTMAAYSPKKTQRRLSQSNGSQLHYSPGYSMNTGNDIRICNMSGKLGEAQQNLHQDPISPNGDMLVALDFNPVRPQESCFSDFVQQVWDTEMLTQLDPLEVSQLPLPESLGTNPKRPVYSNLSAQFSPASSDMTGRSISPDSTGMPTPTQIDLQSFDCYHLPGEAAVYHQNVDNGMASVPMDGFYNVYDISGSDPMVSLVGGTNTSTDPMIFDISSPTDISLWKDRNILGSPISSPILEGWNFPDLINSGISTYNPSLQNYSSEYAETYREFVEHPLCTSLKNAKRDISKPKSSSVLRQKTTNSRSPLKLGAEATDESFGLIGRSSLELDSTAREHPLYHNASPQADGLYHCPWEKEPGSNCQHKPEKLKCNYDKFVDSHLKPYRCKVIACKELHFSSTACLLRHEREAHAMHGHGDKPFLCTHEGCERGIAGNGFPRHWNLRDHMKRVHNVLGQPKSNASSITATPSSSVKGRKRKASSDIQPVSKRATQHLILTKPREPSTLERYNEKQVFLMAIVNQLQDPSHPENLSLLRKANDCIKTMVQSSQRINSARADIKQTG